MLSTVTSMLSVINSASSPSAGASTKEEEELLPGDLSVVFVFVFVFTPTTVPSLRNGAAPGTSNGPSCRQGTFCWSAELCTISMLILVKSCLQGLHAQHSCQFKELKKRTRPMLPIREIERTQEVRFSSLATALSHIHQCFSNLTGLSVDVDADADADTSGAFDLDLDADCAWAHTWRAVTTESLIFTVRFWPSGLVQFDREEGCRKQFVNIVRAVKGLGPVFVQPPSPVTLGGDGGVAMLPSPTCIASVAAMFLQALQSPFVDVQHATCLNIAAVGVPCQEVAMALLTIMENQDASWRLRISASAALRACVALAPGKAWVKDLHARVKALITCIQKQSPCRAFQRCFQENCVSCLQTLVLV